MDQQRAWRGRVAATVIAGTLALVCLTVEKDLRHGGRAGRAADVGPDWAVNAGEADAASAITWVAMESMAVREFLPTVGAQRADRTGHGVRPNRLTRPPQPATAVVLGPPTASGLAPLPLHSSAAHVSRLMSTLEEALQTPVQQVALQQASSPPQLPGPRVVRKPIVSEPPTNGVPKLPVPQTLFEQLNQLDTSTSQPAGSTELVSRGAPPVVASTTYEVMAWKTRMNSVLQRLVEEIGVAHAESLQVLDELNALCDQGIELAGRQTDYARAARILETAHAARRRQAVWRSIAETLDGTSVGLAVARDLPAVQRELQEVVDRLEAELSAAPQGAAWKEFLRTADLKQWAETGERQSGALLAADVLDRMHRPELTPDQRRFLRSGSIADLRSQLIALGTETVDFRELLEELEQLESDSISRIRPEVARKVQVLHLSHDPRHRAVAAAINDYYRNANLRICLTRDFLQRFLPEESQEFRPVRRFVLGADTRGNSVVRTHIDLQFIPDDSAWNLDVAVRGRVDAATRSSKGPAVFFNDSQADIETHRYVRFGPQGYQITNHPTQVTARETLRNLRTDFDGLPLLGEFVRAIAREQFDQQRHVARRLTQRMIARETDAELDARIHDELADMERDLQDKIIGPLRRLNLDPMIVAMDTTADRLTARYRVADAAQMAAASPRPRAPSEALVSLQLHESAINNAIDRLGLSDRTWTLPELYEHLGRTLTGQQWETPEDVPDDILVRFASSRPITVRFVDGRAELTLRIAELSRPGKLKIQRFIVTSSYVPVAEGMNARLERDGVVQIQSRGDRLALRLIFAKVFVAHPEIPLVAPAWQQDPRADGLEVSQVDLRNGWFAIAVSRASQATGQVARSAEAPRLE
ncbi:MAG: hypothetical protein D6753_16085 [Planctomycetota bacterium]|nr:MAG: hypothetical protein D6753_16085 [Planctomycetota bacterium]